MFEITRCSPVRSTSAVRNLVNLINDDPFFRVPFSGAADGAGTLPIDVFEEDGNVVVRASLPGFDREDVDVQVHDGVLTIKAEHREETETRQEKYYRRERRTGSVSRRVALPGVVSQEGASAELKDGVLTLCIPQVPEARPHQIQVK